MYWTGLKYYLRLRRNLHLSSDVIQKRNWESLRHLVKFAWDHVPLYRKHFAAAGFSPEQLRRPEDVVKVPTTCKSLFQQADLKDCIAREFNPEKLVKKRTSGSSGSPLNVYYSSEDRLYRTLMHLRILFHNGMKFRDRMAHISDSRHVTDERYGFQKLGFLPKDFIYAADFAGKQLEELIRVNPEVIYSYSSSMALLAAEVEKRGVSPIHPRLIFTTGELLSLEERQRINQAFAVKLRDIYGLVEMGDIAWQCPAGDGYHLNTDSFWVEIDADGHPALAGEAGRLIITNLHSHAMPFIRYVVGDVLTPASDDPCACGCTFPKIQVLQGRADDWLYTAGGLKVSPLIFVVASIPGVLQYRMTQTGYEHLIVDILPGPGYSPDTLKNVEAHVLEVMGPGLRVEVRQVDHIPKEPSGKMRRVISQIESLT
jgi:phenylacetate-CoA ligase